MWLMADAQSVQKRFPRCFLWFTLDSSHGMKHASATEIHERLVSPTYSVKKKNYKNELQRSFQDKEKLHSQFNFEPKTNTNALNTVYD